MKKKTPMTESELATAALHVLNQKALTGDAQAVDQLWQIGMLATDLLRQLALKQDAGKQCRELATHKTKWPFIVDAISEIRNRETNLPATPENKLEISAFMDGKHSIAVGNATNVDAFAAWIGLGTATGLRLHGTATDGSKKGATRSFHASAGPCELAWRAWRNIRVDRKHYHGLTDEAILTSRYHTWDGNGFEAEGEFLIKNQKTLLEYVREIRKTTEKSDDNQWMKSARLWLLVTYEGDAQDAGATRWPREVYNRAKSRSVHNVLEERLTAGMEKLLILASAKRRLD